MVTAGVYLIARMWPLFEATPAAANVGAIVGCVTLLVAATIAVVQTDIKRVIAYSTMSQIGYMIMGVSSGAYAAGMFHLMSHAFFKALLFMGAGSVIGAMAGMQNMDRMGGLRKALPFTFMTMLAGALALAAIPPFSGFWSKDEILADVAQRGGWHWVLFFAGYVGAFLTAIYTFRMMFRVFSGPKVPEAIEIEGGHLPHAEQPTHPTDGEIEDPEVGFPGPGHYIAERELPMKIAMGALAVLATIAGALQIPGLTEAIHNFLAPTFEGSKYFDSLDPSIAFDYIGLACGAAVGLIGIFIAWWIWVRRPGTSAAVQARFKAIYELLWHKWYFDELFDAVVVRPGAWIGRFAQNTFERLVVDGALVGGSSLVVRAGSAAVRAAQSGLLRSYAALLVLGVAGVALYFLLQS
jgi:NADH-quinone oxidoreductase subunit L